MWTGSVDRRGVGMVRIDGKLRTVQRAAWEFAYGPVPQGGRVNTCAVERACVRIDHLSLAPVSLTMPNPVAPRRRAKGSGSIRQRRPGVWEVTVAGHAGPDGHPHRRSATIKGDRAEAERAVSALAASIRHDLGDLRVRELVGRFIEEHRTEAHDSAGRRDTRTLHDIIEPALRDTLAATLRGGDIERALRPVYRFLGLDQTRHALQLLRRAYQWAIKQHWCEEDPTADITIRTLM